MSEEEASVYSVWWSLVMLTVGLWTWQTWIMIDGRGH